MSKKKKLFTALISIATVASLSVTVFAKQITETATIVYNNIKIMIDGTEYNTEVEPFIYNGTTYLPVRAVANAFGKDVDWDAENSTVIIGSSDVDYLNKLPYIDNDYENCQKATVSLVKNGICLSQFGTSDLVRENKFPKQYVAYNLDGKYKKFVAEVYNNKQNGEGAKVYFKGDGKKILYSMPAIEYSTPKTEIEVDVSGQNILYIEAENTSRFNTEIVLDNARLLK